MPLPAIERLLEHAAGRSELLGVVEGLAKSEPGIVLATGQAASGKIAILCALAERLAREGRGVTLLASQADDYEFFHPLPAGWHE